MFPIIHSVVTLMTLIAPDIDLYDDMLGIVWDGKPSGRQAFSNYSGNNELTCLPENGTNGGAVLTWNSFTMALGSEAVIDYVDVHIDVRPNFLPNYFEVYWYWNDATSTVLAVPIVAGEQTIRLTNPTGKQSDHATTVLLNTVWDGGGDNVDLTDSLWILDIRVIADEIPL